MAEQQLEVWKEDVAPVLRSKLNEFKLLGYENIDEEAIWNCVVDKINKKKKPVHLHELVNVILNLRLSEYMNRVTISSYQEGIRYSEKTDLDELIGDIDAHVSNKRYLT